MVEEDFLVKLLANIDSELRITWNFVLSKVSRGVPDLELNTVILYVNYHEINKQMSKWHRTKALKEIWPE